MNYYDYRSYFQDLIDNTDQIHTELQQQHTDVNARLDTMQNTIQGGITLIAALIVITAAIMVFFK